MSEEQVMSIEATSDRAAILRQMADQMDRDRYGHGYAAAALREYAALITADLSEVQQAQAPGWQDIETAPKDGRTVQLGYFNSHGKWRSLRGQWMSAEYIAEYWEEPDDGEPGWYETSVEKDDTPNCWRTEPTHWAPLLAAPQQGSKT